jgi:hypothetical protein
VAHAVKALIKMALSVFATAAAGWLRVAAALTRQAEVGGSGVIYYSHTAHENSGQSLEEIFFQNP